MERVLPWRRQGQPETEALGPLLQAFHERHPKGDASLILKAYETAERAHEGQVRRSGEPFISHPLAVATVLAGLGMDDITLAAALLHDSVEDTAFRWRTSRTDFGPVVAQIVDGVTKLERVSFDSRAAAQAATMRKMLVAMAKDPRVLLIKLGDRLHNMRTLAAMPEASQKRSAQETLDIYAPLAHRFGIADIKWQLEDLSFATLHPRRYAQIEQMVAARAPERDIYLAQVIEQVEERLVGGPDRGTGHRPAQAPLFDLRENGAEKQGVRRDLRPGRRAGHRQLGEGLLGCAGRHPRDMGTSARTFQGLHKHTEVQPLPVSSHDGRRAAGQASGSADPYGGNAQPGREGHRRPLGL